MPPFAPLNPPWVAWNRNDPEGSIAIVIGLAVFADPPFSSVSVPLELICAASGPPPGRGSAYRNLAALVCPDAPMPSPYPGTEFAEGVAGDDVVPEPDPELVPVPEVVPDVPPGLLVVVAVWGELLPQPLKKAPAAKRSRIVITL